MTDETNEASAEAASEAASGPAGAGANDNPSDGSQSGYDVPRRHPRAPLQILIQHRFSTVEEFIEKYSSDLSMGGLFLRTEELREEGALVYLQFALRNGEKLIEGLGQIVRVNPAADGEGRVAGLGIEFVNFDDESLSLIEEIVVERIRKNTPSPDA